MWECQITEAGNRQVKTPMKIVTMVPTIRRYSFSQKCKREEKAKMRGRER